MNRLKAIIIDDETPAREVLSSLLTRYFPEIEIVAEANNLEDGVQKIKELSPNVVFLDVQMPKYAGYEISNFLSNIDFSIIFVTAYDQYALKAFELSALDYLLKPIEVPRLKQAIEKLSAKEELKATHLQFSLLNDTITNRKTTKIAITDKGVNSFVEIKDIIAIEGQSSYCKIYTQSRHYLLSKNLKQASLLLDDWDCFFRCHKSWLININHIENYSKKDLVVNLTTNITAKLSRYKTAEFSVVCSQ